EVGQLAAHGDAGDAHQAGQLLDRQAEVEADPTAAGEAVAVGLDQGVEQQNGAVPGTQPFGGDVHRQLTLLAYQRAKHLAEDLRRVAGRSEDRLAGDDPQLRKLYRHRRRVVGLLVEAGRLTERRPGLRVAEHPLDPVGHADV